MKPIRIFYSWQSDTDWEVGQNFIKVALEAAIATVASDRGVVISLDHDTRGVPGHPPVLDTILEKIRASDIFVCDLTFVGKSDDGKKRLPNPNVLGEYGYALRDKSTSRLVLAMNEHFGPPDDLPFDLRNMKHPIRYTAAPGISDGDRRRIRANFVKKLTSHLDEIVRAIVEQGRAPSLDDNERVAAAIEAMCGRWNRTDFPGLVSTPKILFAVFPLARPEAGRLRPQLVNQHIVRLLPAGFNIRQAGSAANSWSLMDQPRPVQNMFNPSMRWFMRVHPDGAVDAALNLGAMAQGDPFIPLPARQFEAQLVDMFDRISGFLGEMGLRGEARAIVQFFGSEQLLLTDRRHRGQIREPFIAGPQLELSGIGGNLGDQLSPLFDMIWMASGYSSGSPSFEGKSWAGYGGSEDYQIPAFD